MLLPGKNDVARVLLSHVVQVLFLTEKGSDTAKWIDGECVKRCVCIYILEQDEADSPVPKVQDVKIPLAADENSTPSNMTEC